MIIETTYKEQITSSVFVDIDADRLSDDDQGSVENIKGNVLFEGIHHSLEDCECTIEKEDVLRRSNLIDDYQIFIEKCQQNEDEFEISLVKEFNALLLQDEPLSIEPVLNSNFFNSVILAFINIRDENPDEISLIDDLLLSLKILLPNISLIHFNHKYGYNEYERYLLQMANIANALKKMISFSDEDVLELSLDCFFYIANNNILNLISITFFNQDETIQYNEYIDTLFEIFNHHIEKAYLSINSVHICQTVIQIYGTFCTNVEGDIIRYVFEKLKLILLNSKIFFIDAINEIEKFMNSKVNIRIIAECHGFLAIEQFLLNLQKLYHEVPNDIIQLIDDIKEFYQESQEKNQKLDYFKGLIQKYLFVPSNFETFLNEEIRDENYLRDFQAIPKMDDIIQGQIKSMIILCHFVDNLIFVDFNPKLLINVIENFDIINIICNFDYAKIISNLECQRYCELFVNTFRFIIKSIVNFPPFSELFFSDSVSIDHLINFPEFWLYKDRVEAGLLFAQLIRIADQQFITKLIDRQIISNSIQILLENQDPILFKELAESLCKIIDLNFGEQILPELQEVYENIQEWADETENKDISWIANILLKKIDNFTKL